LFTWDKNPGETAPGGVNLRLTKSKKPAKLLLAVIFDPGPDQYSPKALLLCKNFSSPTPRVRDAIFFLPRLSLVRAFAARCGSCFCCLIQFLVRRGAACFCCPLRSLTPFGTESFLVRRGAACFCCPLRSLTPFGTESFFGTPRLSVPNGVSNRPLGVPRTLVSLCWISAP